MIRSVSGSSGAPVSRARRPSRIQSVIRPMRGLSSRVVVAMCTSFSPTISDSISSARMRATRSAPYSSSFRSRQVWVRITCSNFS